MIRFSILAFALVQNAPSSADQPAKIGAWTIERDKDSMTDAVVTSVHVKSTDARIDYGCNSGRGSPTMLIVTSKAFLGGVRSANFRRVMFRADSKNPVTVVLRYADDTATATYNDVLIPVKSTLAAGKSLVVRLETDRGEPIETTFDITGGSDALAFVDQACTKH